MQQCNIARAGFFSLAISLSGVQTVSAADTNIMAHCALVPFATFTANATTTVGLTTRASNFIHWLFFDQDGNVIDTGSMQSNASLFTPFVLSQRVPPLLEGELGYLLFCADSNADNKIDDTDAADLAANAFFFAPDEQDVAFIPTVPVFSADLVESAQTVEFTDLNQDPIDNLNVGALAEDTVILQYLTDGVVDSGNATNLYIYSTDAPSESVDMQAFGASANDTLSVSLGKQRLNIVDVESIENINTQELRGGGLLVWEIAETIDNVFAFSIASSPNVGAAQTLLAHVTDESIVEEGTETGGTDTMPQ